MAYNFELERYIALKPPNAGSFHALKLSNARIYSIFSALKGHMLEFAVLSVLSRKDMQETRKGRLAILTRSIDYFY